MNLKEAFRFQNKLQSLTEECSLILKDSHNTMKTTNTTLYRKVMEGVENEETTESAPSEYADRINDIVELMMRLLTERERLFTAIRSAKAKLDIDFDAEASLNTTRREMTSVFRRMAELRGSETLLRNCGCGYRFNAEGNQVSYKCDIMSVTTINFDRNKVRGNAAKLSRRADEISTRLDRALVNTEVEYEAPFDVSDTFADVFEVLLSAEPRA